MIAHLGSRQIYLSCQKKSGGIEFPDPIWYYQAVHLSRILDWCNLTRVKNWIPIEQSIMSIPLKAIPWLSKNCPNQVKEHPIVGTTYKIARSIKPRIINSLQMTNMTPWVGTQIFYQRYRTLNSINWLKSTSFKYKPLGTREDGNL